MQEIVASQNETKITSEDEDEKESRGLDIEQEKGNQECETDSGMQCAKTNVSIAKEGKSLKENRNSKAFNSGIHAIAIHHHTN